MSTMTPSTTDHGRSRVWEQFGEMLARTVRAMAFWSAIALPFLYVPLLVRGLAGQEAVAFAALVVANVLALVVGHDHRRDDGR